MDNPRRRVLDAVSLVVQYLEGKTQEHYTRVLQRSVRELYNERIDETEFVDKMIQFIETQIRKAWNEGMRNVGLDPRQDMTDEWRQAVDNIIAEEFTHVEDFAADIIGARENQTGYTSMYNRVDMWANRYQDVVNQAEITCKPEQRFEWVLGATEKHCDECLRLNGKVATGSDWEASQYRPQSPPNPMLGCGGWKCDCRLEPTDKKPTQEGPPVI